MNIQFRWWRNSQSLQWRMIEMRFRDQLTYDPLIKQMVHIRSTWQVELVWQFPETPFHLTRCHAYKLQRVLAFFLDFQIKCAKNSKMVTWFSENVVKFRWENRTHHFYFRSNHKFHNNRNLNILPNWSGEWVWIFVFWQWCHWDRYHLGWFCSPRPRWEENFDESG